MLPETESYIFEDIRKTLDKYLKERYVVHYDLDDKEIHKGGKELIDIDTDDSYGLVEDVIEEERYLAVECFESLRKYIGWGCDFYQLKEIYENNLKKYDRRK